MNELTAWQRERILERLRAGRSLRQIQLETGHRRETIANYGRPCRHLAANAAPSNGPSRIAGACGIATFRGSTRHAVNVLILGGTHFLGRHVARVSSSAGTTSRSSRAV